MQEYGVSWTDCLFQIILLVFGHSMCDNLVCQLICNICALRVGKQRLRDARIQAVDYLILLLAGACLGTIAKVSDESFGAVGYTYTVIAICKSSNSDICCN